MTIRRNVASDRDRGRRIEEALAACLYGGAGADASLLAEVTQDEREETALAVRRMVLERAHRGTGGLIAWYPQTIAAWRRAHPDDGALDSLAARFCSSDSCRAWRESSTDALGISLEEALHRFFLETGVVDVAVLEEEYASAIVRSLAITPRAVFRWPAALQSAPGGCFLLTGRLVLHAALDGRYVRGAVTPLVVALLSENDVERVASRFSAAAPEVAAVFEKLRALRLVA